MECFMELPSHNVKKKFQASGSTKQMSRLDDLILEAVTKLKEPRGSSRHSIADYIEVRHLYRIAPWSSGKDPTLMHANGAKKNLSDAGKDGPVILTKAQIDGKLEKMKSMTAKEAAAAAAQAVAEAEAEAAIAVAEAAQKRQRLRLRLRRRQHSVANAAQKALNCDISGFEIKWQ